MGLDLVTGPLYTSDRPDNVAYILQDSGAKLLVFENAEQWEAFAEVRNRRLLRQTVSVVGPAPQAEEPPTSEGKSE